MLQGSYVYGNYVDEVLNLRRGTADYYYHSDAQWNTVALADAAGDVVERYEYGDFGEPKFYDAAGTPLTGSLVGNPCLFTGQRCDDETGFYWCKSRYLESRTGRFTSRDPIGLWGDPLNLGNPYTYTGNNPWSWLDPYGLCSDTDGDEEESWWERLNTPSEGNDARSMFPLSDVEMRDRSDVKDTYVDPDFTKDLGNNAMDDVKRAAFGNLNESVHQAGYSGMRDGAIAMAGYAGGKAVDGLTGEGHHGISRGVHGASEKHPNLKGKYKYRDPNWVTQAKDAAAHKGYQGWHRDLDKEVAEWIEDHPEATQKEFEDWLRWRYSQPDLKDRFPNGF